MEQAHFRDEGDYPEDRNSTVLCTSPELSCADGNSGRRQVFNIAASSVGVQFPNALAVDLSLKTRLVQDF